MKKSLLIGALALICVSSFALSASPPARDVGKCILVDDHSSVSLTAVVRSYNLNVINPDLICYIPENSAPVFYVVSNIDLLSNETVLNAADEPVPPERCTGSDVFKPQLIVKKNLHLMYCCIRQCFTNGAVSTATGSRIKTI